MNDHALAGSRHSPWPQAMWQISVVSTVSLLLALCLFLAGRRIGGAFDQPLNSPTLLLLGIAIAAIASGLRAAWPRTSGAQPSASSWFRLLLPSLAVFLFCYALSLPGSAPWAVTLLWFLVVSAEGAWWLADSLSLPSGRQHAAAANRSPSASTSADTVPDDVGADDVGNDNSLDTRPELDLTGEFVGEGAGDVTQQMTRLREEDGSDLIFGQARAEFVAGERSQAIHLAFCPPLAASPRLTVMHAGGPAATITVALGEPFGARFDVRLAATAREPESVMVEFEARCAARGPSAETES